MTDDFNPSAVLDDTESWFLRFISFTDIRDAALLALWVAHTHLADELYTTPRLRLDSTVPESGKTTVLDHFSRLCYRPVQAASLSSPALLPRLLEHEIRTILLDEVDRSLRPDRPGVEDLLGVVNSGYRRGATRPVLVPVKGGGWESRELPTFAPVAMAGNAPNLPADTLSRELRVLLMPDRDGRIDDSDWEYIGPEAEKLHGRIAEFADRVRGHARGLSVSLPQGCLSRAKEKWRPLKRVAVLAGGRWPAVADELITRGLSEDEAEREAGLRSQPPGMVLLCDLAKVWPSGVSGDGLVPTRELVAKLIDHNPDYWGEQSNYGKTLSEHRFSKLLAQAAKLTSLRPGGHGPRGYRRSQFEPVWRRLGIGEPSGAIGAIGATGAIGAKPQDALQLLQSNQLHQSEPIGTDSFPADSRRTPSAPNHNDDRRLPPSAETNPTVTHPANR